MKKKGIAAVLTVAMLFSLAACNSSESSQNTESTASQTTIAETIAETTPEAVSAENQKADIVIIGAGAAGMSAAVKAAPSGLKIVVLEKQSLTGGASIMASTGINAGSSNLQLATEEPYTADQFYEYALSWDYGYDRIGYRVVPVRDDFAKTFAYNSADAAEWIESLGVEMKASSGSHSLQLVTKENGAFGYLYLTALADEVNKFDNVDLRVDSRATEILTDDSNAVSGVVVSDKNGEYTIDTKAVLIATGGYASADSDFYQTYAPEWDGYYSASAAGSTGDGIIMADALGAQLEGMDAITCTTATIGEANKAGARSLANALKGGVIMVNTNGDRFVKESAGTADIMEAIKTQPDAIAYVIADAATLDTLDDLKSVNEAGLLSVADSIEDLAAALGLDAEKLTAAIASAQNGDTAFENDKIVSDYAEGPFYGVQIKPAKRITTGGIVTNGNAEVLDNNNNVIVGLYAAGETTAYGAHPLSAATIFGRQAADSMVTFLGK